MLIEAVTSLVLSWFHSPVNTFLWSMTTIDPELQPRICNCNHDDRASLTLTKTFCFFSPHHNVSLNLISLTKACTFKRLMNKNMTFTLFVWTQASGLWFWQLYNKTVARGKRLTRAKCFFFINSDLCKSSPTLRPMAGVSSISQLNRQMEKESEGMER